MAKHVTTTFVCDGCGSTEGVVPFFVLVQVGREGREGKCRSRGEDYCKSCAGDIKDALNNLKRLHVFDTVDVQPRKIIQVPEKVCIETKAYGEPVSKTMPSRVTCGVCNNEAFCSFNTTSLTGKRTEVFRCTKHMEDAVILPQPRVGT